MQFTKRLSVAFATGALLLNLATPAFAGMTLEISGNGSSSNSTVNVTQNSDTNVTQNNTANVTNNVSVNANTGDNDANDNTGGDVSVKTGDATSNVSVSNAVNSNSANVDCCPGNQDVDLTISGNGTHSDNDIDLDLDNDITVYQNNDAYVKNKVDVDADTGHNDAEDNTGGDVSIETGDANTTVSLSTLANVNSAVVGGGDGEGGSLSAWITGNGSNSDNHIDLDLDNDTKLTQLNDAYVDNDVYVDADTGWNDANDNTGGEVLIDTGDANADVSVDNMVNFNAADVDCGCLLGDVWAKIAGNGTGSDNDIDADLTGDLDVYQNNDGDLKNKLDVDGDTGHNDAEDNTLHDGADPTIETGNSESDVEVSNEANANFFGEGFDLELPGDLGLHFGFDLDLEGLLGLLGL